MKIFELETDVKSYSYPIIKIIASLAIIATSIERDHIYRIQNAWLHVVVTLICLVLTLASAMCIYISVGELFYVHENRKKAEVDPFKAKQLSIETVLKIVSENDIVELEVYSDNKIIKIGASADCKYSSSVFDDKLYYIEKSEYKTIEQFTDALTELFPQKNVPVLKIDDLPLI